jgi:Fe2+ transport system protein FeoA
MLSVNLVDLRAGDKVKILGFNPGNIGYQQKLLSMGLVPNAEFTVIRVAPLGDPVQLRIQHSFLCVRKKEAAILKLERI